MFALLWNFNKMRKMRIIFILYKTLAFLEYKHTDECRHFATWHKQKSIWLNFRLNFWSEQLGWWFCFIIIHQMKGKTHAPCICKLLNGECCWLCAQHAQQQQQQLYDKSKLEKSSNSTFGVVKLRSGVAHLMWDSHVSRASEREKKASCKRLIKEEIKLCLHVSVCVCCIHLRHRSKQVFLLFIKWLLMSNKNDFCQAFLQTHTHKRHRTHASKHFHYCRSWSYHKFARFQTISIVHTEHASIKYSTWKSYDCHL